MPLGGWTDFSHKVKANGIQLTKGKHVLKYCANTPGNIDKFVLTRTGELEDISNSFTYPVTKAMSNPLFAEWESPMYNSWIKGPLYTADASRMYGTLMEKRCFMYMLRMIWSLHLDVTVWIAIMFFLRKIW